MIQNRMNNFDASMNKIHIFQAGTGLMMIWSIFDIWPMRNFLYSDKGWISLEGYFEILHSKNIIPFQQLLGSEQCVVAYLIIMILLSLRNVFFKANRLENLMLFLLFIGLKYRNPAFYYGGDAILGSWLFYLIFVPFNSAEAKNEIQYFHQKTFSIVVLFQLSTIYFCAGFAKIGGETWWNGDAIKIALAHPNFGRISIFEMSGNYIFQYIAQIVGLVTLFFEVLFILFIWNRFGRIALFFFGIAIHLGILLFMDVGQFSQIIMVAYIFLLPDHWVNFIFYNISNLKMKFIDLLKKDSTN